MKTFSFIIPLILSILCLLYLLFYPSQDAVIEHDFSARVFAKESGHNTISNALFLTTGSACKEKLEAHEICYYYTNTMHQKIITFSINSNNIQDFKANLLSDTGKHISYNIQKKQNSLILTPYLKSADNTERIFLCLTNQSVYGCTVQIQITSAIATTSKPKNSTVSKPKTATSKPKNSTASKSNPVTPKPDKSTASKSNPVTPKSDKSTVSKPNVTTPKPDKSTTSIPKTTTQKTNKSTASNSNLITTNPGTSTASNLNSVTPKPGKSAASHPKSDKALTTQYKKAILQQQFLLLPPNTSRKITITNYSQKNAVKQFTWISINPNIATIENGIITTHEEGTAIIYLKDKKYKNNTSSCLIRVLRKDTIID